MRLPYPHLPLVHLELGETRDHLPDPPEEVPPIQIVETIDWVMSLPNVRLITLNIYQWEYNPDYYLIKPWKERRGGQVELDCRVSPFQGLLGTIRYFPMRDDMIRATHFPRGMTIANLNQMIIPGRSSPA
ncbi:hypothetical protein FRC03_002599 [Tulasnella sp. 419]|nr:hypothetical protein FRC03_002599 [Tulasnella sp. 419]